MLKKNFFIILTVILISTFGAKSAAQTESLPELVTDVRVENNRQISTSTILSKIRTQIGSQFSRSILNEDIRALYATGYFTDIQVDVKDYQEGLAVIFSVTEKPVIKEIVFRGNEKVRTRRLERLVDIEAGQTLDRFKLVRNTRDIERFYIEEGFHLALVDEQVDIDELTNEARIFILIDEGVRYRIRRINVEGNTVLSDREIRRSIKTRRNTLFTSGIFRKEVFEEDLKRIKRLYEEKGYSDVAVEHSKDYEEKAMVINIKIDEGEVYRVGRIEIEGNTIISDEEIQKTIEMKEGASFIRGQLQQDTVKINEKYFDKGYISAEVRPDVVFNRETESMDIVYYVREGRQATIEKIEIGGNIKTKDVVIRRELKVVPGDIFDGEKLRRSRQNLNNLGYFEEITFETEPGVMPEAKNLLINVKETRTGEISFGGGYSSVDNLIGFVELRQRNFDWRNWPTFTGAGQDLSVRAEFGSERRSYDISFTEPWLFNKPISFGFDLYNRYIEREVYDEKRLGGNIRLGKRFSDHLSLDGKYKLEEVTIKDIDAAAHDDVWHEEGKNTISSLSFSLTRDTRDNIFSPTSGGIIRNTVEGAGGILGGDKDFVKYTSSLNWYFPHLENNVFEVGLQTGLVDKFGDTSVVPIYERFYAGGANTIRGYGYRDVGPKSAADDPIGGNSMAIANLEYTFPIFKPVKGAVFYDVGNVWEKVSNFGSSFRSAVGVGVRVTTPLGPVKLDYGYGLDYEPGEKKGRFHFSMTRGF
jgi:outer membrane protein insertion porin family